MKNIKKNLIFTTLCVMGLQSSIIALGGGNDYTITITNNTSTNIVYGVGSDRKTFPANTSNFFQIINISPTATINFAVRPETGNSPASSDSFNLLTDNELYLNYVVTDVNNKLTVTAASGNRYTITIVNDTPIDLSFEQPNYLKNCVHNASTPISFKASSNSQINFSMKPSLSKSTIESSDFFNLPLTDNQLDLSYTVTIVNNKLTVTTTPSNTTTP